MIRLKRVAVALIGLILALQLFGAAMAQTSAAEVSGQITYLIDFIRTSKRGVLFGPRDSGADRVMDE